MGIECKEGWDGEIRLGCGESVMGVVGGESWVGGNRLGSGVMTGVGDLGIVGKGAMVGDGGSKWIVGERVLVGDGGFRLGDVMLVGKDGWNGEVRLGVVNNSRLGDVERMGDEG